MGSWAAARLAGYMPKMRPVSVATAKARTMEPGVMLVGRLRSRGKSVPMTGAVGSRLTAHRTKRLPPTPRRTPTTPPMAVRTPVSTRNCQRI